jgi:hypothetical protein
MLALCFWRAMLALPRSMASLGKAAAWLPPGVWPFRAKQIVEIRTNPDDAFSSAEKPVTQWSTNHPCGVGEKQGIFAFPPLNEVGGQRRTFDARYVFA